MSLQSISSNPRLFAVNCIFLLVMLTVVSQKVLHVLSRLSEVEVSVQDVAASVDKLKFTNEDHGVEIESLRSDVDDLQTTN